MAFVVDRKARWEVPYDDMWVLADLLTLPLMTDFLTETLSNVLLLTFVSPLRRPWGTYQSESKRR